MARKSKVLFLLVALSLLACAEAPLFDEVYSFDGKSWGQDEKPVFKFTLTNTEKEYDFTLTLRTTTDYKYKNLWIFLKTETPEGITAREPFEIKIADETGAWIGKKTGSIVESQLSFSRRKLPQKGEYTFTVEQGITQSTIDEVLDLSFRVEEVRKED